MSTDKPPRPPARGRRWTSFVAPDAAPGEKVRSLSEDGNPDHRLRVEHDSRTLLLHLSDEDGHGWTTFAVDRPTRQWAGAHAPTQKTSAEAAYEALYGDP
jgi:hypothetical protein